MTVSAPEAEGTFTGAGGRAIFWRRWSPEAAPRALVVIAHGFGEHSGRYEHVAARLVGAGLEVWALDHHGHGRSAGARARISFADAVRDLDTLVARALAAHAASPEPGGHAATTALPVFLLGHSMGGAIALRYAMAHGERLSALIVSGPLAEVEGHAGAKLVGRVLGRLAPGLPVTRLDPALVSRDPEIVAAYEADPLVHHEPIPAGTVAEFLRHADSLPGDLRGVTVPTLVLYGTADRLCAPSGAVMVSERLGSAEVRVIPYDGLYHEVFNEPEGPRVLDDVVGWLDERLGGETPARPL